MPERSGYVKSFKIEGKINKLMSFRIDHEKYSKIIKLFGLTLKT